MDLRHFGPTIAGIKTAQILNELGDLKIQRKFVTLFQDFCVGLKELGKIDSRMVFESLWEHWKRDYCDKIQNEESLPEKLRTHFTNTLVGMARDTRRLHILNKGWEGTKRKQRLEEEIVRHRMDYEEALKEAQ